MDRTSLWALEAKLVHDICILMCVVAGRQYVCLCVSVQQCHRDVWILFFKADMLFEFPLIDFATVQLCNASFEFVATLVFVP